MGRPPPRKVLRDHDARSITTPMEIDAIIPWVDGDDPAHAEKRRAFADMRGQDLSAFERQERTAEIRWRQAGELHFTLRSLDRFAPWLRRVLIVTDDQAPPLDDLPAGLRAKLEVIDHREAFAGHLDLLPNFNSASIETAAVMLPGLSDRLLLLNDDTFLAGPCDPTDFFDAEGRPVLRGTFAQIESIAGSDLAWHHHQARAATVAGRTDGRFFKLAHVAHTIRRDLLGAHFAAHPDHYRRNLTHRFRDKSQFNPASLSAHLALAAGSAVHRPPRNRDWHFLPAAFAQEKKKYRVRESLRTFQEPWCKLGCVNDMAACLEKVPHAWNILGRLLAD